MAYPVPDKLVLPVAPYEVTGYSFKQRVWRRLFLWATHLGDDIEAAAGTKVVAVGAGEVVWAEMRAGSVQQPNWGGVVVIGHMHRVSGEPFFSVYGHLCDVAVRVGDHVEGGYELGLVAEGLTPENGWWQRAHLHFAIYVGPWTGEILPGYKRLEEWRTRVGWWREPKQFIEEYNRVAEAPRVEDTGE